MVERLRGRALQRMRKLVATEQPLCPDCEKEGRVTAWYPDGELDHIRPIAKGGTNDRSNLQGTCKDHNRERRNKSFGFAHKDRVRIGHDGWPVEGKG